MVGAMDLADRNVVVTGAARGIGAALARRFAAGGARVVVADVGDVAGVVAELPEAIGVTVDVSTEQGNVELIARAEVLALVDLFFANAGIGGGTDLATSEESWQQAFDVNVNAHRWAAKHLIDGWLARWRGLLLLDGIGRRAAAADRVGALHAHQAGGGRLRRVARRDVRERGGLRVSCLCPQGVNTEMLRTGDDPALGGGGTQVVRSAGVVLEPEQVADVVADAIAEERFLILPHPEVQEYMRRKADDPDRSGWPGCASCRLGSSGSSAEGRLALWRGAAGTRPEGVTTLAGVTDHEPEPISLHREVAARLLDGRSTAGSPAVSPDGADRLRRRHDRPGAQHHDGVHLADRAR